MTQSFELGKEYPPESEESQIQEIMEISHKAMLYKSQETKPPVTRDQHPKSHGYVQGEFTVEGNIPEKYKVGVFAEAKTYPIWIRFSNGSSDRKDGINFKPDTDGDIRGMAIKLMDVEGTMAFDDPDHPREQDFILMNSPIFFIRDIQGYIDFFPVVRALKKGEITFNPDGSLKDVPANVNKAFGLLTKIQAKATSSPLGITYWSATPYKLGEHAMKYSAVPQITGEKFDPETATDPENYLREAMTKHLASKDAYFDFKIQLQTDALKMPVEDPTEVWDENESPYDKVATIKIPQQDFNTEESLQLDEKQSFSPWHSLEVHRPLGGVNRARKIYIELAKIRNQESQS